MNLTFSVLLIVFLGFYVILFLPSLFTNQIPYFMDIVTVFYPVRCEIARQWHELQFPLWNTTYFGGSPLLGNPQWGILYPGNIPFFLMPSGWMFTLTLLVHAIIGACGLFFLSRRFIHSPACLLAPTLFLFSGYVWAHYAFGAYLCAICWIPFLFLAFEQYRSSNDFIYIVIGAVILSMQILAGAPQIVYYTILTLLSLTVIHPLFNRTQKTRPLQAEYMNAVRFCTLVGMLGLLLSLPQIIATFDSLDEFGRRAALPIEQIRSGSLSLMDYISVFWGGTLPGFEDAETISYVGVSGLFLIFCGMLNILTKPKSEPLFSYTLIIIMLCFVGSRLLSPVLYHILPMYSRFHDPKRLIGIIIVLLPLCASRCVDVYCFQRLRRFSSAHIFMVLSFVALTFFFIIKRKSLWFSSVSGATQLGWLHIHYHFKPFVLSMLVFILTFGFSLYSHFQKVRSLLMYTIFLFAIILDLTIFSLSRIDVKMIPASSIFNKKHIDQILLKKCDEDFRFSTYDADFTYSYEYTRTNFAQMLLPDCGSYYGLQDFQGYDPWKPHRYERFLEILNQGFVTPYRMHFGLVRNLWSSSLLERACVKYIIGDAIHYHLPKHPRALLSPANEISCTTEWDFNSDRLFVSCLTVVKLSESSCLTLRISDKASSDIIHIALSPRVEMPHISMVDIKSMVIREPYQNGLERYIWQLDFSHSITPESITLKNVLNDHRIFIEDISFSLPEYNKRFAPVKGIEDDRIDVWEVMSEVSPMISMPTHAFIVHSVEESSMMLMRQRLDSMNRVIIEDSEGFFRSKSSVSFDKDVKIQNVRINPGNVWVQIAHRSEAFIVLRQAFSRHWKAKVNGKPQKVVPVDLMFCGVLIPPNYSSDLTLYYAPSFLITGCALSIITLLAAAVFIVVKWRRLYLNRRINRLSYREEE